MCNLSDAGSAYAGGEKIVDGRTVSFAEKFPCARTQKGIKHGNSIREAVLAGCIVEHAAVVRMGKLVARETVIVPYPSTCEVLMEHVAGDVCPYAVLHVVIPSEHKGVDSQIFNKCLEGWILCGAISIFAKEVEATFVWSDAVHALEVHASACYGVIPNGVRLLLSVCGSS